MLRALWRRVAKPADVPFCKRLCNALAACCVAYAFLCACWTAESVIQDARFAGRSRTTDTGVTTKKDREYVAGSDGSYYRSRSWYTYTDHTGAAHEHAREYVFYDSWLRVEVGESLPPIEYLEDDPGTHRPAHFAGAWRWLIPSFFVAAALVAGLRLLPWLAATLFPVQPGVKAGEKAAAALPE